MEEIEKLGKQGWDLVFRLPGHELSVRHGGAAAFLKVVVS